MSFRAPTAVVGHPTSFAHAESRVFTAGMRGSDGVTLPLPTANVPGGPGFNATYVRGQQHSDYYDQGVQNSNGFSTYHMAQNLSDWQTGDTAPGLVTFARRLPASTVRENMRHASYAMFGVPEFNRRMRHSLELRRHYGTLLHATEIRRDYGYVGVQQSKQTLLNAGSNYNEENNFVIKGRARIPNLWLALTSRRGIGECDNLYLVLRRHKYRDGAALDAASWNATTTTAQPGSERGGGARRTTIAWRDLNQSGGSGVAQQHKRRRDDDDDTRRAYSGADQRDNDDRVRVGAKWHASRKSVFTRDTVATPTDIVDNKSCTVGGYAYVFTDALTGIKPPHKASSADVLKLTEMGDQKTGAPGEYYWSWDPWVSHDRSAPPTEAYCGDRQGDPNNQFVGDYIHIGQLVHISKGPNNPTNPQITLAREALYPTTRGTEYWKPLRMIDEVECHVGMGRNAC